jgi:galactonate dehydratase
MKITAVKAFIVNELGANRVFARVYTDEGLTGLGEGSLASRSQSIAATIAENERYLLGKDPRNIEGLWQSLYRHPRWRGGPILNAAISALECALWDILGKSLNVPIYQLLGGACRDRIRVYGHVGAAAPEAAAEQALALVEQGYTAMKTSPYPRADGVVRPRELIGTAVAKMRAMRAAVGEDVDILFDCHGTFTPPMIVELAERLEDYRPLFIEEATQAEDLETLAWVAQRTSVSLATGERLFTKWGFTDLVSRRLVSYVQPDVALCGGIAELKKIATMAEARFMDVAPHNGNSEVGTLASVPVDACTPNCVIQERPAASALAEELFGGTVEVRDGFALLPDKPGLGLDLNEAVAARHPFVAERELTGRARLTWPDGSIADP